MKKILLIATTALLLFACKKESNELTFTSKQKEILNVFNGKFTESTNNESIVFLTKYDKPVQHFKEDPNYSYSGGKLLLFEAHGECVYQGGQNDTLYFNVSDDGSVFGLKYRQEMPENLYQNYEIYNLKVTDNTQFSLQKSPQASILVFDKE